MTTTHSGPAPADRADPLEDRIPSWVSTGHDPASAPGNHGPDAPPPRRRPRRLHRFGSWLVHGRVGRALLAVALLFVVVTTWSVGSALSAPGNDPAIAKLAEWARDHRLGPIVTWLEDLQYQLAPPKTGGSLDQSQLTTLGAHPQRTTGSTGAAVPPSATGPATARAVRAVHPPLAPLVSPPVVGEGTFQTKVAAADGTPAVQVAYLRPDPKHTSYLAAVVVMNTKVLRFEQHPGYAEPGGNAYWKLGASVPPAARPALAAAFNSGFKMADCRCGYYADGHTVGTMQPGAASMVFHTDGSVDIGSWGTEVTMGPTVTAVRQNLRLLVDNGRVPASVDGNIESGWGLTIKGAYYVWRSGVGITADGNVVYVCGPTLNVRSLANLLADAGAVRAMETDINPDWVDYTWYTPTADPAQPTPTKILPFVQPANRYLAGSSRDFVAAFLR